MDEFPLHYFGDDVRLFSRGSSWFIGTGAPGLEFEVDMEEANGFLRLQGRQPDSVAWQLESRSLRLNEKEQDKSFLAVRRQIPNDGLVVMLDTTTVADALTCLKHPNAISLLDLSVLTFAYLCFDWIVIQPYAVHQDRLVDRDVFVPLRLSTKFITETLWSICADLSNEVNQKVTTREELEAAWCKFLSLPEGGVSINLDAWDSSQNSPPAWDGVSASMYQAGYFRQGLTGEGLDEQANEFLSVQTFRTLYNDRLAGLLSLPYVSSAFRGAIHGKLISKKIETQLLADKLLCRVGGQPVHAQTESTYTRECSAPFLLACILQDMRTPDDYWIVARKYREKLAPLRRMIAQDRDKWIGRPGHYINQFVSCVNGFLSNDLRLAVDSLTATAHLAATVSTATATDAGLAKLAIKLTSLLKPADRLQQWYLRRFKPQIYVVRSLAEEAKSLQMVEERLASVWGARWTRQDHDQLEHLSQCYPSDFMRLRQL